MDRQDSARRLLLVHAHPDDESIGTGATIARYAAEGAQVTLVTCTLGELGEVIPPELAHLATDGDRLGEHRITELAAACAALGIGDQRFLGGPGRWRDSGMMGLPGNDEPGLLLAGRPDARPRPNWPRSSWTSARRCWSPTTRTASTATPTTSRHTG